MFCLARIKRTNQTHQHKKYLLNRILRETLIMFFTPRSNHLVSNGFAFTTDCFEADVMPGEKNSKMENLFEKSRINLKLGNNYMMYIEP